jgi:hypothetical protein
MARRTLRHCIHAQNSHLSGFCGISDISAWPMDII